MAGKSHFDGDNSFHRPDHPDFWSLSQIVMSLDGLVADGPSPVSVFGELFGIDLDSLLYVAANRARFAGDTPALALLDGFAIGVLWERQRQEQVTT